MVDDIALTVPVTVVTQFLLSVTVTVYVPEPKPVLLGATTPPPQLYAYGEEPPVTDVCNEPSLPAQVALVTATVALRAEAGCVIVAVAVAGQLCASVTVTVYVPAGKLFLLAPVVPPAQL
jgi:hypothetical protein